MPAQAGIQLDLSAWQVSAGSPPSRGRAGEGRVRDKGESTTMPAYWLARSKVNDPAEYKKYADLVPGIVAKYGGKFLARGGRYEIVEGPEKFHRFIVIEFPTLEQGVACFRSKEYDDAARFRRSGAGEVETVVVEGI